MKKIWLFMAVLMFSACSTKYILMDENGNPVDENYYTDNTEVKNVISERNISANDVFVVDEGSDFVTYQYKSVRVDEISPLASLYCADLTRGASPYLREVNMYHNGFMRATFDCVNLAI